jgi:hypothetical protein
MYICDVRNGVGATSDGALAGLAVPDTGGVSADGDLAAESAGVLGVLGDFHLLHLLTQGSTITTYACQYCPFCGICCIQCRPSVRPFDSSKASSSDMTLVSFPCRVIAQFDEFRRPEQTGHKVTALVTVNLKTIPWTGSFSFLST